MILHRYWEGEPSDETCKASAWIAFDVVDWTFDDLPEELRDFLSYAPTGDEARHRANLVRYWALATYGGIWADMDVFPRNMRYAAYPFPENAWVAGFRGEPCGCLMGGDSSTWRRVFEYACLSPVSDSAYATSGKFVLRDFVDSGDLELQSGLLSADTKGAPFRHLWLTANRRRNGRSV